MLTKDEVRQALESFFAVGQPGGKGLNRFDELMQARARPLIAISLDTDSATSLTV